MRNVPVVTDCKVCGKIARCLFVGLTHLEPTGGRWICLYCAKAVRAELEEIEGGGSGKVAEPEGGAVR